MPESVQNYLGLVVVLALGYPDPKVSMHLGKRRVEMDELVHEERWSG